MTYPDPNEISEKRKALLEQLYALEPTTSFKIRQPSDCVPFLMEYENDEKERFIVILLNGQHDIISTITVSIGIVNKSIVHPREVFIEAIRHNAVAIIIAHNHPSGALEPSSEDRDVTERLKDASNILGIPLIDHIIFSKNGYHSFLESGSL